MADGMIGAIKTMIICVRRLTARGIPALEHFDVRLWLQSRVRSSFSTRYPRIRSIMQTNCPATSAPKHNFSCPERIFVLSISESEYL